MLDTFGQIIEPKILIIFNVKQCEPTNIPSATSIFVEIMSKF